MTTATLPIDTDLAYAVDGYRGVAFRIVGVPQVWEPDNAFIYDEDAPVDDETGQPGYWIECDDGEWVDDHQSGQVVAVMIGDDRRFTFDVSDLTPLDSEDYCSCCGQVGCGWG